MSVWWEKLNQEKWKSMMSLIYRAVNEMGRLLTDEAVYEFF